MQHFNMGGFLWHDDTHVISGLWGNWKAGQALTFTAWPGWNPVTKQQLNFATGKFEGGEVPFPEDDVFSDYMLDGIEMFEPQVTP